jgi:uncharacterized protein YkwD
MIGLLVLGSGCYSSTPTPDEAARMTDQVLQLVNLERASENLPPVAMRDKLVAIADKYAGRMIDAGFFGHRDPITGHGVGERAHAGKYAYYAIGENLAIGQETPAEVMRLWMESPAHRAVILDPEWKEVGIALRFGGEYSIYWVQVFAHPAEGL